ARQRELAIRAAIGASRARLARQLLVEAVLLAMVGGACGVAIAYGAMHAILAVAPADVPRLDEVHLDLRLLLFSTALTMLAWFLVGFVPALRCSVPGTADAIGGDSRTTEGRNSGRLRSVLVTLEVALSTACLIIGGL